MNLFEEWCSKVKLIVSEVDGIITDHLIHVDELGNVPFKGFYMKDFEAINELRKTFGFVFLSSDNSISYHLCRHKNIPFFYAPKDKNDGLKKIMQKYNVSAEEVLYIGSTFSDLKNIKMIPFTMCPLDSINEVKTVAYHVLENYGSGGVICEVYDLLRPEIIRRKPLTN